MCKVLSDTARYTLIYPFFLPVIKERCHVHLFSYQLFPPLSLNFGTSGNWNKWVLGQVEFHRLEQHDGAAVLPKDNWNYESLVSRSRFTLKASLWSGNSFKPSTFLLSTTKLLKIYSSLNWRDRVNCKSILFNFFCKKSRQGYLVGLLHDWFTNATHYFEHAYKIGSIRLLQPSCDPTVDNV